MKKSEYLKEYGIVVDYPQDCLELVKQEVYLTKNDMDTKYFCEDVRFSDITILREDGNYLAIELLLNDFLNEPFWSNPFPTEILKPEQSELKREEFIKLSKELIKGLEDDK